MKRQNWTRSRRIDVAVTPYEHETIGRAAKAAGLSVADWMRSRALPIAERELDRQIMRPQPPARKSVRPAQETEVD